MIPGGSKCVLAGHSPCEGRIEWHHVVKQQRLKREFKYGAYRWRKQWHPVPRVGLDELVWPRAERLGLDDILGDTRNRIWLCSKHHELHHKGRVRLELPEQVWEFAREFGLDAALENDLRRQVA